MYVLYIHMFLTKIYMLKYMEKLWNYKNIFIFSLPSAKQKAGMLELELMNPW